MMKILILDDEVLARQELAYLIEHSQVLENPEIFQAEDIAGAEKILFRQTIDILFLDISLSEENGFSLAQRLQKLAHPPFLIFATAYDNYAVKAFETNAADYILKPFEQERIDQSLKKVQNIRQLTQKPEKTVEKKPVELLSLALADRSVVLKVQEIVSANIEDGLLSVSTESHSYQVKKTLNWFKQRVTTGNFLQIHRNTVVNLEMIHEVQPWFNHTLLLVMKNGEKFPVGRSYLKELNAHLTL